MDDELRKGGGARGSGERYVRGYEGDTMVPLSRQASVCRPIRVGVTVRSDEQTSVSRTKEEAYYYDIDYR